MQTVTYQQDQHKPDEGQDSLTLLLARTGTVLAATAWECFLSSGRGVLILDGTTTWYLSQPVIRHERRLPAATKKTLLRAARRYHPTREMLVLVLWVDQPWTVRRVVTTPDPETAFLQRVGTPGLPPLRCVRVCQGHDPRVHQGGNEHG